MPLPILSLIAAVLELNLIFIGNSNLFKKFINVIDFYVSAQIFRFYTLIHSFDKGWPTYLGLQTNRYETRQFVH